MKLVLFSFSILFFTQVSPHLKALPFPLLVLSKKLPDKIEIFCR